MRKTPLIPAALTLFSVGAFVGGASDEAGGVAFLLAGGPGLALLTGGAAVGGRIVTRTVRSTDRS